MDNTDKEKVKKHIEDSIKAVEDTKEELLNNTAVLYDAIALAMRYHEMFVSMGTTYTVNQVIETANKFKEYLTQTKT